MKYIVISLFISGVLLASTLEKKPTQYRADVIPKKMSIKQKKERFFALLVPAVNKVHNKLLSDYQRVLEDAKLSKETPYIKELKKLYRVESVEELLVALKPHPKSITLAQAAMESAWGTSRFFTEANNVFGVWSVNKDEPRIAASEKRGGTKTIWLRKFDTIEESVEKYYKLLATSRAYREFRDLRYSSDDVFALVKKLDRYSEMREKYGEELAKVIRYNKLTKYD